MLNIYVCSDDQLTKVAEWAASEGGPVPVWIDLINPTPAEDKQIEDWLGIAIPTRAEMEEIELSARLYNEDGAEFMTMTALTDLSTDQPLRTPVTFILKNQVLVTVRYADPRPFSAYMLRAQRRQAGMSATGEQVMLGLLEAMTDRTADALEKVGSDVDALARTVFQNKATKVSKKTRDLNAVITQIGSRAELLIMIQDSLVSISRLTAYHAALAPAPKRARKDGPQMIKLIQRDALSLGDHAKSLSSRLDFLLNATLGVINLEQNQIIKIFSVAAVVFLPPTLVASIYGMNFTFMPELGWRFGYPWAILLMIISAVVPFLFFKRRGWL
jgi:magnesium transporter